MLREVKMGKVMVQVKVKNFADVLKFQEGSLSENEIRQTDVLAQVDTGAALLSLPPELISRLGLTAHSTSKVLTANGKAERRIFTIADITIQDRNIQMQVMENDMTTPPLIGYLVLEAMDWVVDTKNQKLIGNPEHDGKWVIDML